MHRRLTDQVEIRPLRPAESPQGRIRIASRLHGGPLRFFVKDQPHDLHRRRLANIEAGRACEQLVQNGPEGVDVGVKADQFGAQLLRGRVGDRHHLLFSLRVRRSFQILHLLGNTEIEQTHFPVGCRQNVGRLQVPMNDGPSMRVLDRFTNFPEQGQRLGSVT
jgi:hypothetical protein